MGGEVGSRAVFERLTGDLVKDGKGPLVEKGRRICAPGGGMG